MILNPKSLRRKYRGQILMWMHDACVANQVPELLPMLTFEFNSRFTSRMGDANLLTKRLRFSAPLWEAAGEDEQHNTVIHEVCHIIAGCLMGERQAHGAAWRHCMLRAGEQPTRTHSVNRDHLKLKKRNPPKRYLARCACREHVISAMRYGRMTKGSRSYYCKRCRTRLRCEGELV